MILNEFEKYKNMQYPEFRKIPSTADLTKAKVKFQDAEGNIITHNDPVIAINLDRTKSLNIGRVIGFYSDGTFEIEYANGTKGDIHKHQIHKISNEKYKEIQNAWAVLDYKPKLKISVEIDIDS